ncbi:MAG TPA: hypothetical protein V6D00_01685 [Pantanalinema sp.]
MSFLDNIAAQQAGPLMQFFTPPPPPPQAAPQQDPTPASIVDQNQIRPQAPVSGEMGALPWAAEAGAPTSHGFAPQVVEAMEDRWRYQLTQPKVDLTDRDLLKQPLSPAELENLEAHAWANNEPIDYKALTPRVPLGVGDYWGARGQGSDRDRAYQQSYENINRRVVTDEYGRERLQTKFPGGGAWENLDEFRLWDDLETPGKLPPLKQSVNGQSAFFDSTVPDDEIKNLVERYMPRLKDSIRATDVGSGAGSGSASVGGGSGVTREPAPLNGFEPRVVAAMEDRWRYQLTQPKVDLTDRDLLKQPLSPAELENLEAHAWANNEPIDYKALTPRVPLGVGDYWGALGQGSERDRAHQQSYENINRRVVTDEYGRERLQTKFPGGGAWENLDEFRLWDDLETPGKLPPLKQSVNGQSAFFNSTVPDDEIKNLVDRFMPRLKDSIRKIDL